MNDAASPRVDAFAETAALYALMQDRGDDASRIIGAMLPGERALFANQLTELAWRLGRPCRNCGALTTEAEAYAPAHPHGPRGHLCRNCGLLLALSDPVEQRREQQAVLRDDALVSATRVECTYDRCPCALEVTGPAARHAWRVAREHGWTPVSRDPLATDLYCPRPLATDLYCPRRHDADGNPIEDEAQE
jgi:hypothetical protein